MVKTYKVRTPNGSQPNSTTTYFWGQTRGQVLRALTEFIENIEDHEDEYVECIDDMDIGGFKLVIPKEVNGEFVPLQSSKFDQLVYGISVTF